MSDTLRVKPRSTRIQRAVSRRLFSEAAAEEQQLAEARADARKVKAELDDALGQLDALKQKGES